MQVTARTTLPLRPILWTMAALILLAPLVAMQFTTEMNWDESDFIIFGVMIGGAGLLFEGAVRASANRPFRAAIGLALAATFLLIWINGAVGIIGSENNPLNQLYAGVILVAFAGSVLGRFCPNAMARAMVCAAAAQMLVSCVALYNGHFTLILDGFFAALWLTSAMYFRKAARQAAAPND